MYVIVPLNCLLFTGKHYRGERRALSLKTPSFIDELSYTYFEEVGSPGNSFTHQHQSNSPQQCLSNSKKIKTVPFYRPRTIKKRSYSDSKRMSTDSCHVAIDEITESSHQTNHIFKRHTSVGKYIVN